MKIFGINQAGFRITTSDGKVVMTDPWLKSSWLKIFPTPIDYKTVDRCDAVLISHAHIDHLDDATLDMVKRLGTLFVGSTKAAQRARKVGVADVVEMKEGDETEAVGLKVHAVFAEHPFAGDAIGFVIKGEKTIYFSGDTRYSAHLVEKVKPFKPDIAMVQIACATYHKRDGMKIPDAARLVRELGPSVAIPMHFHDRFRHPDPEDFTRALSDTEVRVDILRPGDEKEY